ncbi:hypothetical protein [Kitasatospora sp. LaBMicrA B282]|uniref:hypothetical protein n=1 Tax=Kitasatospora sp. LaBMicrA B282 TaxID=3420949 RepID=UPI003D0EEC1F
MTDTGDVTDTLDVAAALRGGLRDRRQAWSFLRSFAADWTGRPLRPADGLSEAELAAREALLGFRLPAALREGYALLGHRADLAAVHADLPWHWVN